MTAIDYDALRGETAGAEPPDGIRSAYLARASLVSHAKGDSLVTEWQSIGTPTYYWTTWFGFDGKRLKFTQEFLDSIKLSGGNWRAVVMDDEPFEQALSDLVGTVFSVRTEAGASWVNTYVEDIGPPAQGSLGDVPLDTEGLPAVGSQVGTPADDDDIPF